MNVFEYYLNEMRQFYSTNKLNIERIYKIAEELIKNTKDYYHSNFLFSHMWKVAILSYECGKRLKLDSKTLLNLIVAALIHDMGIIFLEININKKELTEEEKLKLKTHPDILVELLIQENIPSEVLSGILYHHERLDGSGYPRGIKATQIPLISRIIAISDVIEAVSSDRPYRKALKGVELFREVMPLSVNKLDEKIMKVFVDFISIYPLGSRVLLSNGISGIVYKTSTNPFRPIVKLDTGKIIDLTKEEYWQIFVEKEL